MSVPLLPVGHVVGPEDYNRLATRTVTSTTRPSSPFNGQLIFETDTQRLMMYHVVAVDWIAVKYFGPFSSGSRGITAGLTQGGGVFPTFSVSRDEYRLEGSECTWVFHYVGTAGVAGTAGQALLANLPFANARNAQPTDIDGLVLIYNPAGSGRRYNVMPERGTDANTVQFGVESGTGSTFGAFPNVSFTTSWQIRGTIRYRWR